MSKMLPSHIEQARRLRDEEHVTWIVLAKKFGVCVSTIRRVVVERRAELAKSKPAP